MYAAPIPTTPFERVFSARFCIDTLCLAVYLTRCYYTLLDIPFRHRQAANYTLNLDGRRVAGATRRPADGPPVKLQEGVGGTALDVERVRREWEQWRLREETAFAKRLREKASLPGVACVPWHSLYRGSTYVFSAHVVLRVEHWMNRQEHMYVLAHLEVTTGPRARC